MTQPEEAVGGATDDTVIAAEPTIEDRFAAIADDEPRDEEAPEAPAEDAPEAEEPELEVEDEDLPPIKPPVSWTAEEQEEFNSLPRALQETLTRREAEREKFVQSKAQEAKRIELTTQQQLVQQVSQAQEHYMQTLQSVLPELPEKPPAHLMAQDPHTYAAMMENYENAAAWHTHAAEQAQAIQQQQAAAYQQLQQLEDAHTHAVLSEQFPEFLDAEKGPELKQQLRSTALALGYSDDHLQRLNAHEILAAKKASEWKAKADKFDTLMAKQMDKVRQAKALPRVSKPGAAQPKGAVANERYQADRAAMRAGNKDAAIRVFSKFV
jgi:hypothetical protein